MGAASSNNETATIRTSESQIKAGSVRQPARVTKAVAEEVGRARSNFAPRGSDDSSQLSRYLFITERDHGIYLGRAARWDIAGKQGDSDEDCGNHRERLQVVGADAKQQAR